MLLNLGISVIIEDVDCIKYFLVVPSFSILICLLLVKMHLTIGFLARRSPGWLVK